MGLFGLGESKGLRCEQLAEGAINCKVYKEDGKEKVATGTEVTIIATPENNCEPVFANTFDMNDSDLKKVEQMANIARRQCKKGLA